MAAVESSAVRLARRVPRLVLTGRVAEAAYLALTPLDGVVTAADRPLNVAADLAAGWRKPATEIGANLLIRIVLVEEIGLLRGALRAVLSNEDDLEVVADLSECADILGVTRSVRPDIVVVDMELKGVDMISVMRRLRAEMPEAAMLALSSRPSPEVLHGVLQVGARGFVGKDLAPVELARLVRAVARGERVVDPMVAVAVLSPRASLLTARERDVLLVAAEGLPVKEIARRLFLAEGTVRNHLSAVMRKTGTRNRLEAIRWAQRDGWL